MTENDVIVIYEGNTIEVMRLIEILQENNIKAVSAQNNWGGLNPGLNSQITVNERDKENALRIIKPVIKSWVSEYTITEINNEETAHPIPDPEYIPTEGIDESDLPPKTRAVLSEIRLMENSKPNAAANIFLFIFSLFLFYRLGIISSGPANIIFIIIILFIHELGHFASMKFFGYRDLKMFFLPMFGAAVTGKESNPGEVKRAIVSLMGPLPGIIIGIISAIISVQTGSEILKEYALLSIIINGFNLLPFYPLDGGQFFGSILFSRNIIFEISFKILGIIGLFALLLKFNMWILLLPIYFIIISIPASKIISRFTTMLKDEGYKPTESIKIPHAFIIEIVPRMTEVLKSNSISSKKIAGYISQIWIKLKIKKPSLRASAGFTFLYVIILLFIASSIFFISTNQKMDESKLTWEEFTSSEGRCSISMPGKAVKSVKNDGNFTTSLYSLEVNGTGFAMGYSIIPEEISKKIHPQAALTNSMNASKTNLNGEIITNKEIYLNNAPGKEFIIDIKNNYLYISRIYFYNNRQYFINVATPKQNRELKFIKKYMDSFRFL